MYGYVRPLKGEMKVREYQQFRAAYCGLCHCLKDRCGLAARFVVNFDCTCMAMLLSASECFESSCRRCIAKPFCRRDAYRGDAAFGAAADFSVILAYFKLKDSLQDDRFFARVRSRLLMLLLNGAYKKAKNNAPAFHAAAEKNLLALSELERKSCASMDASADCFARILAAAAEEEKNPQRKRILEQIFYHIGRIVYILDAVDDFEDDIKNENYNVLSYRFGYTDGKLSEASKEEIALTLELSEDRLYTAFELLDAGIWTSILRNILFEGLPAVSTLVLNGEWRNMRKKQREKMNGADI